MDIRTTLARSHLIKTAYETSRRKFSEARRRAHIYTRSRQSDRFESYRPDSLEYGFDDSGLFDSGSSLVPHPEVNNPVLTRDDIDDCWARFVADPFVVHDGTLYHLFFEIKSMGGHVFIGHAYSENGLDYTYNRIVLQPETAQHTYPHVFNVDDSWKLIPSPGSNVTGQFRIYESINFPTEWTLDSIPIEDDVRLDPTPILYEDTLYLIYQEVDSYEVVLAYADELSGPWQTHPDSPLFRPDIEQIKRCQIGSAEMVPSGRPLYCEDGIHVFYRSHVARELYHYRITELTRETFEQEQATDEPVFARRPAERWNGRFMHSVNPVYPWLQSKPIVAVDGLPEDRYRWAIGIYTVADEASAAN
jgi:hypothetical protein